MKLEKHNKMEIKRRPVTLRDIANRVGVSHGVVSVVLSGRASTIGVSDKTRKRIIQEANMLGYRPNILGRSLADRRSFLIGLLAGRWYQYFILELTKGLYEVLEDYDYSVVLYPYGRTLKHESEQLRLALDRKVDGLIVNAAAEWDRNGVCKTNKKLYLKLQRSGLPIIEIGGNFLEPIPSINADHYNGAKIAVEYLLKLGHKRIAHLTHDKYRLSETQKGKHFDAYNIWLGYKDAMRSAGLNEYVFTAPLKYPEPEFADSAYNVASEILNHPFNPTAIFCYTRLQAIGLSRALIERGIQIPQDISIVTYGDTEDRTKETIIPLTSVCRDEFKVGQIAGKMIMDAIQNQKSILNSREVYTGKLVIRQSSGPPPE